VRFSEVHNLDIPAIILDLIAAERGRGKAFSEFEENPL
jgi:hypothetical protein